MALEAVYIMLVQCSAFGKPPAVLCFVGRHRVHEQSPVFATAICLITEMWHAPVRISSCSFSLSWLGATSFLCLPYLSCLWYIARV